MAAIYIKYLYCGLVFSKIYQNPSKMKLKSLIYVAIFLIATFFIYRIIQNNNQSEPNTPTETFNEDEIEPDSLNFVMPDTAMLTTNPEAINASEDEVILPTTDDCFENEEETSAQLNMFAANIEADSIMYDNKNLANLADCAGMFLRTVQFVQAACADYDYPKPTEARGSRTQARWFYDRNNLVIVKDGFDDAMARRNLIKPGMVMFYGRSGKLYENVSIETIEKEVAHVGVVTEVERDAEGNVIGYTLFHGRSQGKIAKRSDYHSIEPQRDGFPRLGNWNQQWLAIANIMTPKPSI